MLLRVVDVSLGTLRIMLITRGSRWRSGLVGFFESLIWVIAAGLVLQQLDDPMRMGAFAAGFALGTVMGVSLERMIAFGSVVVNVVSPVDTPRVADALRAEGCRVTVIGGEGRDGDVQVLFTVIPRRSLRRALTVVQDTNPRAFVSLEDARPVRHPAAAAVRK